MDTKKKKAIMESTSFDELLDAEYGKRGTVAREAFEAEAEAFLGGPGRRVSLTVL